MASSITMEMRPISPHQDESDDCEDPPPSADLIQKPKARGGKTRYLGLVFAILSGLLSTLQSASVKKVHGVSTFQIGTYRYIGMLLPTLPMLIFKVETPASEHVLPKGKIPLLVLRGAISSISLMFKYYAFKNLPLSDASVIVFSAPIFVVVLARIFLKEMCGLVNLICIIVTTAGLILIAKPAFLFDTTASGLISNWKGLLAALVGTFMSAAVYVLLRKLRGVQSEVVLLYLSTVSIAITASATLAVQGTMCLPNCGLDRLLIVGLGPLSFTAQMLLTLALKWEEAGPVSIVRSADVVFPFLWQWLFFEDDISPWSALGALLVTSSVVVVGVRKWVSGLPEHASARKRFKWLTK